MSNSNYIYKNPLDEGYKQFYLTKKQNNKIFKNRQIKLCNKYEYYYNDNCILVHKFCNWKGIIANTILLPIVILVEGIGDFKEIMIEYKELYNQKKCGSFIQDNIYKDSNLFNEVIKVIKEKGEQI